MLIIDKKEGFIIKNKYEDINVIDIDEIEDICDIFMLHVSDIEESGSTIAVIANKELVEYIASELLNLSWTSVQKFDFDEDDIEEYMVSINKDGYVVAMPVMEYDDKYFVDIDVAYISMGGDVDQCIINKCVNTDKEVILFGLSDDDCECDCCGKCDCKDSITTKSNSSTVVRDEDGKLNGFSATWSDNTDDGFYSSSYSFYSSDEKSIRELAKEFGVNVD